jgi:hypothetical protein
LLDSPAAVTADGDKNKNADGDDGGVDIDVIFPVR